MRLVDRTADGIGRKDDTKATVDGAEDRGKHADIGFAAGDDRRSILDPLSIASSRPSVHGE
jgi:hypothetical protein